MRGACTLQGFTRLQTTYKDLKHHGAPPELFQAPGLQTTYKDLKLGIEGKLVGVDTVCRLPTRI